MGGPKIDFFPGRTDYTDDSKLPPRGRLPDGAQGAEHIRFVFGRMGFSDQEIVALSGAHNLGRCHSDRSGFQGPWVQNPTRFSNSYYKLLLSLDWKKKKLDNGIEQYVHLDEDLGEELMMLPTDYALREDEHFLPWVKLYAEDKDRFYADFAKVFAKLIELGIQRDGSGKITNSDNVNGGYNSAPKKSKTPGKPEDAGRDGEADPLQKKNAQVKAKL